MNKSHNQGLDTIETLSLKEAHQLLRELCVKQSNLERENLALKRELEACRAQGEKRASCVESHRSDIDNQQFPQEELSPDKGLLRCIIDTIGDLIYLKDQNGVYRGCNKASEMFVGLTEAEQIGKTDFDLLERDLAKAVQETDRKILASGQEYCIEEWVTPPNGKKVLLESKKAPFYGLEGEAAGIVGISRDITARKQAEDALVKSNQELDAFVYTISHDLRTPLIPIIGYADILLEDYRDQLDERALEFLSEIVSAGEKMQRLMADHLSLATIGQIENPVEALEVGDVVKTVVSDLDTHLSLAGVTVEVGDMPSVVMSRTLLVQIFDNLLINAVKYGCEKGGVIEVGSERRAGRVMFYVRDYGPGVSEDERGRIFEVFYRGGDGGTAHGTGIGLATVQRIAKLHDGRAWVEETTGGGSTFWVDIAAGSPAK